MALAIAGGVGDGAIGDRIDLWGADGGVPSVHGAGNLRCAGSIATFSKSDRRPSFALNLALNYLETKNIAPEVGSEFLRLNRHSFVPFESQDGGYNHADADGYQILINYRNLEGSFDRVSLRDLLANKVPDDKIRGRMVLIGSAATSLNDHCSKRPKAYKWAATGGR